MDKLWRYRRYLHPQFSTMPVGVMLAVYGLGLAFGYRRYDDGRDLGLVIGSVGVAIVSAWVTWLFVWRRETQEVSAKSGVTNEIRVRRLAVVDQHGNVRMRTEVQDNGDASTEWLDQNGKLRIVASTLAKGDAVVKLVDATQTTRLIIDSSSLGWAGIQWIDSDGNLRIWATTQEQGGDASVELFDRDCQVRVEAVTFHEGTAGVQLIDSTGRNHRALYVNADGTWETRKNGKATK